jgi:branched-chain amino acid transport system permease protein
LLALFTADSQRLSLGGLETASFQLAGLSMGVLPALMFVTAIAAVFALNALLYGSATGRAFRATSDDVVTFGLMGQNAKAVFAVATGVTLVIAALASFFLATRASFDPSIGPSRLIFAFEAVIIGGLGSFWGTLAGGITLGVAQAAGGAFDPEWQTLAGHLAFIVILSIRPRGLFPKVVM